MSSRIFKRRKRACMLLMSLWLLYFFLSVDHKLLMFFLFVCVFVCLPCGQCQRMAARIEAIHPYSFPPDFYYNIPEIGICAENKFSSTTHRNWTKSLSCEGWKISHPSCLRALQAPYKATTCSHPERPLRYVTYYRNSVTHCCLF